MTRRPRGALGMARRAGPIAVPNPLAPHADYAEWAKFAGVYPRISLNITDEYSRISRVFITLSLEDGIRLRNSMAPAPRILWQAAKG